jgi:glycosyltransferase involved in cell wall biosynthesis
VPWQLEREVADFQRIDVGLAPMFGSPWHEGKCGFKQVQYMAVGAPYVTSWVGGARDFVRDGVNGLVASSPDEWYAALDRLLGDAALRASLAHEGRRMFEDELAMEQMVPRLEAVFAGLRRSG